jgi:hypothetical protein
LALHAPLTPRELAPEHVFIDADPGRAELEKRPALTVRLNAMREVLARGGDEARKVLELLVEGSLRVSAVETPEGRRWAQQRRSSLRS